MTANIPSNTPQSEKDSWRTPLPVLDWLNDRFRFGIDLADSESTVKFKGVEASATEVAEAVTARDVKRLSLRYQDAIDFKLTSDFRLQGMSLSERMLADLASQNAEDHFAEQQAELFLWAATLEKMVTELLKECGEIVR